MSTNLAYAATRPRSFERYEEEDHAQRVRIVTTRAQRRARPKVVYALVAIALIFAIFLAQLLLSIALSGGAYRISTLQGEQVQDGRVANALSEKLNTVGSTQNLAANARSLGMVGSAAQAFLRLSDGKVLGHSAPAPAASGTVKSGADSSVPNSLLTGIPLVKLKTGGHGASNATDSSTDATQSNSDTPSGSSKSTASKSADSGSNGLSASGALPSPQTN